MFIGYARVSTSEQRLDLQLDALDQLGCEKIFTDTASGARDTRPGLVQALEWAREGDTLVVWKLDRLGRSLRHLVATVTDLGARGVGFRSTQENIDTTTPAGKLIFHMFAALAEFEREIIRERTKAGLTAARARGRSGGRKPKLGPQQVEIARTLFCDNKMPVPDICRTLGISPATLYRQLSPEDKAQGKIKTKVAA